MQLSVNCEASLFSEFIPVPPPPPPQKNMLYIEKEEEKKECEVDACALWCIVNYPRLNNYVN
jgi:hypothetical protein